VLRYGDELGMGDDLSLPERNSVRTAMQWSAERHGGFSASRENRTFVPVIADGEYGYKKINAHDQMRNQNSLLNWMERAISVRKECMEFGWGDYEILRTNNAAVLAHGCYWKNGYAIAVHNFSDRECAIRLELKKESKVEHLIECFSDQQYDTVQDVNHELRIGPFGYRWFRKSALFL
jgi:maltose alpha-D-glucosyltransferase / alpha-amylase